MMVLGPSHEVFVLGLSLGSMNFSTLRRNEPPSTEKAESRPATLSPCCKPTFTPARLCVSCSQASVLSSAELLQPTHAALSLLKMSKHGLWVREGRPPLR